MFTKRQPLGHPETWCPFCHPTNSVKGLKESKGMTLTRKNHPSTSCFLNTPTDSGGKGCRTLYTGSVTAVPAQNKKAVEMNTNRLRRHRDRVDVLLNISHVGGAVSGVRDHSAQQLSQLLIVCQRPPGRVLAQPVHGMLISRRSLAGFSESKGVLVFHGIFPPVSLQHIGCTLTTIVNKSRLLVSKKKITNTQSAFCFRLTRPSLPVTPCLSPPQ